VSCLFVLFLVSCQGGTGIEDKLKVGGGGVAFTGKVDTVLAAGVLFDLREEMRTFVSEQACDGK
jgi:hypothetical protein